MTIDVSLSGSQSQRKSRLSGRVWRRIAADDAPPLRSELFSADQMEIHGKVLAASHKLDPRRRPDQLLSRLADNELALVGVCDLLMDGASESQRGTPAGEWLLDNFYLIEEQIRTAKRHLPKGYSRELPRLILGSTIGRPRVYDIALEAISHGDSRVDTESLSRFVKAYQSVTALDLGELWAIPIMLRLAVIENLRRVGVRIAARWVERSLANSWADKMIQVAEEDPKSLILVIADMARSNPPMVSAFVAEMARRLQGRGPALALPLTWMEQRLAESGQTIEQLVQSENQQQAADQVSISNGIGSLRVLGAMDWRGFVETMSVVERTLLEDPGGVYGRMDFATRDRYRHEIERIARRGRLTEYEVACTAIQLTAAAVAEQNGADRRRHVGFYLIDKGVAELEQLAQVHLSPRAFLGRLLSRFPLPLYLGGIATIAAVIAIALLALAPEPEAGTLSGLLWLVFGLSALLVTSQVAVALVNWLATLLVRPYSLPRMDFSEGIEAESRTLVVVPTMLSSAPAVEELIEALEVRFLANRDDYLHFALLTDFLDAAQESLPEDGELVALACARIAELNEKYASTKGGAQGDIFFLFHRPRLWNPQERVWMGYERKRGKLAALNALLRCGVERQPEQSDFSAVVGDIAVLQGVRYVVTLDTDTQLPRDTVRQFVGTMAHPLNRPRYDATKGRVTEGYGILQPRVAISLPGANRSRYSRLYGGEPGIDPYTLAVSDVYQDVFGEGSFIGKGIYDVDVFEISLGGRMPENLILSHDLLEGCYARSGLLSDVQLIEDYPARYMDNVSRCHRWIRGDWQLAGWLWRRVPGESKEKGETGLTNPLSTLSQWKLIDNLRRSLVATALMLLFVMGWLLAPAAGLWTLSLLGLLLIPRLCGAFFDLFRKPQDVLWRQHLEAIGEAGLRHAWQVLFEVACLPHQAYSSLDAIIRTAWRMRVSHRQLLQWRPSRESECEAGRHPHGELVLTLKAMWMAPLVAVLAASVLDAKAPAALAAAMPILLLWFIAPIMAWWISRPLVRRRAAITEEQTFFLRLLARRTWAFFDQFVGPDDHWLPPDNFQEYRVASIAHRTSPTNIGLALLANLSAYDFGYLSAGRLLERTANTFRTMGGLERSQGHFYNWYDTQTLQPLLPLYISTVDSGNLAGHLVTLRMGLLALADEPIVPRRLFDGLGDTLGLLVEAGDGTTTDLLAELQRQLEMASKQPAMDLVTMQRTLGSFVTVAGRLVDRVAANPGSGDATALESEACDWARALLEQCREAMDELARFAASATGGIPTLRKLVAAGNTDAADRMAEIERLALVCDQLGQMEYDFLFNKARHLLSIGYNVTEHRLDASYYDLLASEVRLCNFVAIAHGKIPQESWFTLGRVLAGTGREPVLLSWSGSMFEYLMPLLVMPTYDNTLLDQTCKAAVARQIDYGNQRGVPWGVSESGYNTVDVHLNYQYRAFGVPGLGLKRGLSEDLVVAPYATMLALMVAPEEACQNLQRLAAEGFMGKFGFFEAIDYTPARQRRGQSYVVVRAFMAHHQGMSLLALAYLLLDRPMQRRFEADRLFKAVMLLLQERIPKAVALFLHTARLADTHSMLTTADTPIRVFTTPHTPNPQVQLLSNGRYHVMVTNGGGGYSRWKDIDITRWREDGTCDNWGGFCYIRDIASGAFWSSSYQPTRKRPESYEAIFSEGRAEFRRRDAVGGAVGTGPGYFETHTEIVVSPEDDIELRRVHITNRSRRRRRIDVTSYAEVVLAPGAADSLHPAFSNLFVQTEILRGQRAIICSRRPRSIDEHGPVMFHLMVASGAESGDASYETDRSRFIGRTRSTHNPQAMIDAGALSETDGSVLDPVVAIRYFLTLEPEQSVVIDMVTGVGETRDMALSLIEKYRDRHLSDRVFDLSWTHSQVALRQLNATDADAQLYGRLASHVIYANAALRAEPGVLIRNRRGQSGLWGYAISGDLPIVLLQIGSATNLDLVRQLVQAHAYWRLRGVAVDLVIWNEEHSSYRQRLQDQIMGMIASGIEASVIDRPGGVFVRPAEQISSEDRILLQSVARVIVVDSRGSLAEQIEPQGLAEFRVPRFKPSRPIRSATVLANEAADKFSGFDLILRNELGGFTRDGSEYVVALAPGEVTPAPWVNVLANPNFGTVISESGAAYTWSENAHEFRLTPWHNDPVGDPSGEAIYLRDEETGNVWSPTPFPARADSSYTVRHGFGYSVFATQAEGIQSELWVYVALDAAVKFSVLKLRNQSGRPRRISATGYVEWVLGDLRAKSAMHVGTEIHSRSGALYARNPYSTEFSSRVAFFDVDPVDHGSRRGEAPVSRSGDRREFIGRNGTLQSPAAMGNARLSGKVGTGLDPCAAIQVRIDLDDGEGRDVIFRLGVGQDADDAGRLVQRFRGAMAARGALDRVRYYWTHTLGAVRVETPDAALDVLANGWLVYQTLACRVWARSGYYQSGGAFGFRDQLQDVMALIHTEPGLARGHLLLCASRQFQEGDVQHWWHPPSGRGVRTHCSDDYLWLPLAVCRYVLATADTGVLDEAIGYLDGRPVDLADDSYYDLPVQSTAVASLYQHCVKAIRHGLRFGAHGLPLIGSGDWNDGMNLVGKDGQGESVWLGFFFGDVLRQFVLVADAHGDSSFAEFCAEQADHLYQNIEEHGWDGKWYRRAYFDDGTPLGSRVNAECQIDSISQSWSVLSGAGSKRAPYHPERLHQAMDSVAARLVRREDALIQLLDPPFDKSNLDPGYIRGYVPGVRENGGQYTHGAIWAAMAFATLGERERAWELLTMINPVNHTLSAAGLATYKVEPYVMAADVYGLSPHVGRGGWSWYTGSAGWMYRLILESLLGLRRDGNRLRFAPCLPGDWRAFKIHYRYRGTTFHVSVSQEPGESHDGSGVHKVVLDGVECPDMAVPLVDDYQEHLVDVAVGVSIN